MAAAERNSDSQDHDRLLPVMTRLVDDSDDGGAPEITATQKMISAMSGSLLTSLLVTPLDVVRVRLQAQSPATKISTNVSRAAILPTNHLSKVKTADLGVTACCRDVFFVGNQASLCLSSPRMGSGSEPPVDCAVQETRRKTYNSTLDGLRKIARNEGFTTLWRGLSPTLVMTIPANIIYFTGYDWLRYNSMSPLSRLSPDNAPLVSGSVARVLAATAVGPVELVRTRMQAASSSSATNHLKDTFEGIKHMVGIHGYTSLWRGLSLTLWRDVPFSGLYWWGYESIRAGLTDLRESQRRPSTTSESRYEARLHFQQRENHADTFVDSFVAGALSGTLASIVTTPFDVGKTRTQVYRDAPRAPGSAPAPESGNIVKLLWHIFKTEGVQGLWKGWIPRTLKVAPACAIMISSYEVGKRAFRSVNERAIKGSHVEA
ncbi:Mitochondrial carrier domain protein [Ophiocordyceps camponoti-floridani]|uniref:Mitochondrial carrier domain protein n=1 Tax=Ophiocordyceps camponoti-floridani TaxID=2030778 RepID=A0A8H4VGU5_9HYPO|nr:Mitochondrial carrier domain protein [Ophiocordyceps camponoti-floridani]